MTKYGARSTTFDFEGQPIDQVRSFAPFGSSRNLIDASVYGDEWTSFVLGLKDGDEVQMVCAFDPSSTTQAAIATAYDTAPDTPVTFSIAHADSGAGWDVTCILTAVAYDPPLDGLLALNITLKIVDPGVEAS
jgi:hypothetical protein